MVISPASSPNSHLREDDDLGDVIAVCSAKRRQEEETEVERMETKGRVRKDGCR